MKAGTLKRAVLFGLAVVVVGGLGVFLGGMVGELRVDAANAERGAQLQSYFEENLAGIAIGEPFPDIVVSSADGGAATHISDIVDGEGLVAYVSTSCDACVETVTMINRYRTDASNRDRTVVLVTRGDPRGLAAMMKEKGIDLPVFQDVEDAFARVYHVTAFPAVFQLNENGVVADMAAGPNAKSRVRSFYTES